MSLDESPAVDPRYFNIMTPDIRHLDEQNFIIQLSNEALWSWNQHLRERSLSSTRFIGQSLEKTLLNSGYQLHPAAMARIVNIVRPRLSLFTGLMSRTKDQRSRKKLRDEWFKVHVHPQEVATKPLEIIQRMADKREELKNKEEPLFLVLAEAEELKENIDVLKRNSGAAHHGKSFEEVGTKQKTRHIKQIR